MLLEACAPASVAPSGSVGAVFCVVGWKRMGSCPLQHHVMLHCVAKLCIPLCLCESFAGYLSTDTACWKISKAQLWLLICSLYVWKRVRTQESLVVCVGRILWRHLMCALDAVVSPQAKPSLLTFCVSSICPIPSCWDATVCMNSADMFRSSSQIYLLLSWMPCGGNRHILSGGPTNTFQEITSWLKVDCVMQQIAYCAFHNLICLSVFQGTEQTNHSESVSVNSFCFMEQSMGILWPHLD